MLQRIIRRLKFESSRWFDPMYGRIGSHLDRVRYVTYESARLKKLRNIHSGKRCFIIGNGPSIKQQDLFLLRNEYTFAMNFFTLHPNFHELDISYYCMSDHRLLWVNDVIPVEITEPLKLSNCTIFLHRKARKRVEQTSPFGIEKKPYYIWLEWQPKVETGIFSTDITDRVYHGYTVVIDLCLPIAHYMGFSEIYLLGCDSAYSVDKPFEQRQDHFYDENLVRHYGKDLPKEHLKKVWNNFDAYEVVNQYFMGSGTCIFNAGLGGKLETFPRASLEEVLSR